MKPEFVVEEATTFKGSIASRCLLRLDENTYTVMQVFVKETNEWEKSTFGNPIKIENYGERITYRAHMRTLKQTIKWTPTTLKDWIAENFMALL